MSQPTSAAITIAAMPAPATISRQRPDEGLDGPPRFPNRSQPFPPPDPDGPLGPAGPPAPDGPPWPGVPLGRSAPAPAGASPEAGFIGCHRTGSRSEPRTGM